MITLGIETSGRAGTIALVEGGAVVAERSLTASGRRHARTLVPELGELLRNTGHTPTEVDVVAVSIGPGSFTGLRVGVVCAKTFAYATGCRIIGIDTFLAVATGMSAPRSPNEGADAQQSPMTNPQSPMTDSVERSGLRVERPENSPHSTLNPPPSTIDKDVSLGIENLPLVIAPPSSPLPLGPTRVWVIDDALRGDLFAGEYAWNRDESAWTCLREPALTPLVEWREQVTEEAVVTGPGVDKLLDQLSGLRLAGPEVRAPRAACVALLGERLAAQGRFDDPWTLEPRYIRRSAAEEKLERP
jgi:tRNA threonylcarbamoyl adenosine modification protein YeaZ